MALLLLALGPTTVAPPLVGSASPATTDHIRVDGAPCGVALVDRVNAQLDGARADDETNADAVLQQRADGQWQLDLVISGDDAVATERSFVAPQCDTVMDAAAFVIAGAFDPTTRALARAGDRRTATEPGDVPEPTPDHVSASTPRPITAPASSTDGARTATMPGQPRARRRRVGGFVRVGGGLDFGALPGAAAVFEAAAGARGKQWRLEALASYRLQTIERARIDPEAGGRFWTWTAGARGCGVPSRRALEFPICLGLDGGQLVAEGFGFPSARRTRRPWVAVAASPGLTWAVHPHAALTTRLELGVPLVRSAIEIENLEVLHRVRAVYGRVWIGVEGRFP